MTEDETTTAPGQTGDRSDTPDPPPRPAPSLATLRDIASLSIAVMIFVHETFLVPAAQPALIAAALALLGLPLVARAESRK